MNEESPAFRRGSVNDTSPLAQSAAELRDAARAADQQPEYARSEARAETRREASRWWRWGILAAVLAAVLASGSISLVAITKANQGAADAAALKAGDVASAEVTSSRASSLLVERRDLVAVNQAMAAAGLTPCPDPGPAASAFQVASVVGECRGTLRAVGELQRRGLPVPGVFAPDPAGGRFPDAGH